MVVAGHDHGYQRFMPANPSGASDSARGMREFVVGTGGAELYEWKTTAPCWRPEATSPSACWSWSYAGELFVGVRSSARADRLHRQRQRGLPLALAAAPSAPAQLGRDVLEDALDGVRVVLHAELVGHGEQERVRGFDGRVLLS